MKKSNVFAWRIVLRRMVATTLIALAVSGNLAGASPADITTSVVPAIGGDPPAGSAIKGNNAAVSSQTGALQYSYPITVSPGRIGMQPGLALSYSSQAPIYGGLAAGWSLDIPEIRADVSGSRLKWSGGQADNDDVAANIDPKLNDKFVSSLAGGRPLRRVTDAKDTSVYETYRAQNDGSFMRYDRMNATNNGAAWRARSSDGTTYLFGEQPYGYGCGFSDWWAPLTTTIDQFGNTVHYTYANPPGGTGPNCQLASVSYGANTNAGTVDTVTVQLNWGPEMRCSNLLGTAVAVPPIGAQTDYRGAGPVVTGARPLNTITVTTTLPYVAGALYNDAFHTRTITLGYNVAGTSPDKPGFLVCNGAFTPYRELTSITESAVGRGAGLITQPPVTFAYGSANIQRTVNAASPTLPSTSMTPFSLMNGLRFQPRDAVYLWPEVQGMYLDFDGDSRPDRLEIATGGNECVVNWYRNTPTGWVAKTPLTLPRLPWKNGATKAFVDEERCSLNGQHTLVTNIVATCSGAQEGSYLSYRWMDMNADGLPDLVTAIDRDFDQYNPDLAPPFGPISCTGSGNNGCEVFPSNMMASLRTCNGDGKLCSLNYGALKTAEQTPGMTANRDCRELVAKKAEPPPPPESPCAGSQTCVSDFGGCGFLDIGSGDDIVNNLDAMKCWLNEPPTLPPEEPPPPPFTCGNVGRAPYTACGSLTYPWWIYPNLGNGQIGPAQLKLMPVPLETDAGESSVAGYPGGSRQEFADFDGDGIPDATEVGRSNVEGRINQPPYWIIKPGDGTGGVHRRSGTHEYVFETPHGLHMASTGPDLALTGSLYSINLTVDLNGDGLRDHAATSQGWTDNNWPKYGGTSLSVGFNDGTRFISYGQGASYVTLPPLNVSRFVVPAGGCTPLSGCWVEQYGARESSARLVDLDADGRPDLVTKDTANDYRANFNLSGIFAANNTPIDAAVRNRVVADGGYTLPSAAPGWPAHMAGTWRVESDFMDLNGDGITEAFEKGSGTMVVRSYDPAGHPPRLLYQISNGRGATTTALYSSMSGDAVEQHPELGKRTPNTMWVVKSMTTSDVFAATTTTTSNYYKNPVFNKDPGDPGEPTTGKWSFRGFEEVTTTGATGAKTVQRFGYGNLLSPDWSGRLTTTLTRSAEAPAAVVSISETQWSQQVSGNNYITTYHPLAESKWTCKNGQDESTCRGDPSTFSKNSTTYSQLPATGSAQVWVASASQAQGKGSRTSTALANGDRTATATFALVSTATQYFLRSTATSSFVQTGAALVANGKTETLWTEDGLPAQHQWLAPIRQRTYFNATQYAESRVVYDWPTGNVLERWKPEQLAAATTKTTYTYDPYKLYVLTETNEKGHAVDTLHDYGTGAVVSVRGPNIAGCAPTCSGPLKEEHNTKVDAWGRPTSSAVTLSQDGGTYTLVTTATMSYNDKPVLSGTLVPTSMTSAKLIEVGGTQWTQDQADYDGNGRLLRTTQFANGAAAANAVTSYTYGNDGKLISVSTPDPTANDSSVVTTLYDFDSLGRPTKIRLPDHTDPLQRSAVLMAYDGASSTTTEILRTADGVPAVKLSTVDAFGRLSTVSEQRTAGATPTWAVTTLTYDGNDNVATITDPENVVTTMLHDWAGRRLQIGRDGKVWLYQYNRNGNMISEQVPGANPDGTDVLKFTNTTVYDDLDRMTSRVIGSRTLSTADQALFGTRSYAYTWDLGGNRIGRIRYASASAPSAATPSVSFSYAYDAQGNRTGTVQGITIAGFPYLERNFTQTFTPNFGPARTYFYDWMPGGTVATQARNIYDARGLPLRVDVSGLTGSAIQQVAVQTRNVAGVVTKRRTDQLAAVGAMTFVESNWVYDKLGRPLSQTIARNAAGATVQVAKQQLAYFGNSDPKQLMHTLGASNTKTFTFSYDPRHQLTGVTTSGAAFTGGYTFGNAGRLSQANVAANVALPGSDVKQRNVNYVYGTGGVNGVDKEAVTALTNVSGGAAFASYLYDAAGNQTKRTYAAGNVSWDYLYDGEDQLRRVTKRTGTTVNGSEEYWYDENGGRLAIVYRDPAGLKTGLRWFIGGTEAYYTASGTGNNVATLTKAYTHPTLGTPVARVERTPTAVKIEYQFHGLVSNTLAAVASDGVTNASFMYAPYGEVVEATDGDSGVGNGKDAHRRRVTDKYVDEIGGLMYYGARYYDGVLLGWTQSDPLYRFVPDAAWATPRKGLLYQFVLGNPVRYVDPDGREVGIAIVSTNRSTRLSFDFGNIVVAVELSSQQVNPTSEASQITVAGKTWVLASFETGGYEEGLTSVGLSTVTGLIPVVRNSPIHWGVQAADDLYEDIYPGNYEEKGDITTVDPTSLSRGGGPALPGRTKGTGGTNVGGNNRREEVARGPNGNKKHNSGAAHRNAANQRSQLERFQKKAQKKAEALAAKQAAAQKLWDSLDAAQRRILRLKDPTPKK